MQDKTDALADMRDIITREEVKRNAYKIQKAKEREMYRIRIRYTITNAVRCCDSRIYDMIRDTIQPQHHLNIPAECPEIS